MVFLFSSDPRKTSPEVQYDVQLENASGLPRGTGAHVGVTIGGSGTSACRRIRKRAAMSPEIDRKYADRVRGDSRARLKKLGLLTGDSYVEITPGTLRFGALPPGSNIPAQRQTNVDQLISSGEDLVDNLVQISYSMKNILGRVDRGEGLIGELTSQPETKQRLTDTLLTTLNKTNAALTHIESGRVVSASSSTPMLTANTHRFVSSAARTGAGHSERFEIFETDRALTLLLSILKERRGSRFIENLTIASANLSRSARR